LAGPSGWKVVATPSVFRISLLLLNLRSIRVSAAALWTREPTSCRLALSASSRGVKNHLRRDRVHAARVLITVRRQYALLPLAVPVERILRERTLQMAR
jgi:hypothetical protein